MWSSRGTILGREYLYATKERGWYNKFNHFDKRKIEGGNCNLQERRLDPSFQTLAQIFG